jgi:uncharacterized cupin superfamily protein
MMAATSFRTVDLDEGEAGAPDPERIVAGAPKFRTWNRYESADGRTFCGVWESTPGLWRIAYDEWESCTIMSGRSVVTPEGGTPIELGPGDSLVIDPGFRGTWEVVETTRKTYVIKI